MLKSSHLVALIALVVVAVSGCDSARPEEGQSPPPASLRAAALAAEIAPPVRFHMDDGALGGAARSGVRFRATFYSRLPNGRLRAQQRWLRFPAEVVAQAGGRTRTYRFVVDSSAVGNPRRPWTQGAVFELPDVDAAEVAVEAWLLSAVGVPAGSSRSGAGTSSRSSGEVCVSYAIQLPAGDPICPSGCWATTVTCSGGGGAPSPGGWPPPLPPGWEAPPDPGDGGGSGNDPGPGTGGSGDGECIPGGIMQPEGCEESAPPGVPADYWSSLNDAEREICRSNSYNCILTYHSTSRANSWAKSQTSAGAHNGPQDALRHAMWSADMTLTIGINWARAFGDAHETTSVDPSETRMDLYNNAVGRSIGAMSGMTFSGLGVAVADAWADGRLCIYVGQC